MTVRRLQRRRNSALKSQPLTRDNLDGRTYAAKEFDRIVAGLISDLGGQGAITTKESELIIAFAGAALTVQHVNTRLLSGQQLEPSEQASAVSSLVRVAARLPDGRRARDVTADIINALDLNSAVEADTSGLED